MKNIVLDYDDFHWRYPENCLETIKKLIHYFPQIKITLFTVPCLGGYPLYNKKDWCDEVRKLIETNNIRLAIHGTIHSTIEYKNKSLEETFNGVVLSENIFRQSNLPFIKVFKGPQWGINEHTYIALEQLKYTHIFTHEDYRHLIKDTQKIKSVIYNWNLKDSPIINDIMIGHGHTHNVCDNGINQTFDRLKSFLLNNNVQFLFGDEL